MRHCKTAKRAFSSPSQPLVEGEGKVSVPLTSKTVALFLNHAILSNLC
jgi:hypothetical protein